MATKQEQEEQRNLDKQITKEIMIAYMQACGPAASTYLFPKQDRDSLPSANFEDVWQRIIKTVSD